MEDTKATDIDILKAKRLISKLILMEKKNIKTKQYSDAAMVKKIKKMIEEEIKCY